MFKLMAAPVALMLTMGTALAADDARMQGTQTESTFQSDQQAATGAMDAQKSMAGQAAITSERLLDKKVTGAAGESIGEIKQLVINPQSGQVTDVVVAVGGFLGMGEKSVALDWNQIRIGQDNTLTTTATKAELEQAQAWQDPTQQAATPAEPQTGTSGAAGER